VFRVDGKTSPWQAARAAAEICRAHDLETSLHIRMTIGEPGAVQADEDWVTRRAAEAVAAAAAYRDVHVYLDTFAEVDRGYYRRQGVVDRFFNPRPAFHVIRHLNAALAGAPAHRDGCAFNPGTDDEHVSLMGARQRCHHLLTGARPHRGDGVAGKGALIDLVTGVRSRAQRAPGGGFAPSLPANPCLWIQDEG